MTASIKDLYNRAIMDHARNPRCRGEPAAHTHSARGRNPLCGDEIAVFLRLEDGVIAEAGFTGQGCALAVAGASIMSGLLEGQTPAEVRRLADACFELMAPVPGSASIEPSVPELDVFRILQDYPMRAKCAALPWRTLLAALERAAAPVTTE